jgi:hypothetical protein
LWARAATVEDVLGRHDLHFTVGANIGTRRSAVPTLGLDWRPIWNPVIAEWWEGRESDGRGRFTTIAGLWHNAYQTFEGVMWGPKAEELQRFLALPQLAGEPIEMAVEQGSGTELLATLGRNGWLVEAADVVASTPNDYRDYICAAAGEFSCAKGLHVGSRSGWFSDRSACFLAAGRPVVIQDTGIGDVLPTGGGLFPVSTVEEAADAIRRIRLDYKYHSSRARQIAIEYFDVRRVIPRLLNAMGVE